jgi:hypothetical protein
MTLSRLAAAACLATSLAAAIGGCAKCQCTDSGKDQAACRAAKPGTATTVNTMCVMMNTDPVDPSVKPVVWKGQSYGFCCDGCRSKWDSLTDAQKDAAAMKVASAK